MFLRAEYDVVVAGVVVVVTWEVVVGGRVDECGRRLWLLVEGASGDCQSIALITRVISAPTMRNMNIGILQPLTVRD